MFYPDLASYIFLPRAFVKLAPSDHSDLEIAVKLKWIIAVNGDALRKVCLCCVNAGVSTNYIESKG